MRRLACAVSRNAWVVGLAMAAACSDRSSPLDVAGTPAAITAYAGDGQSADVGTAVTAAPKVRVNDAGGDGVPGVTVSFSVLAGGGAIANSTVVTNADGVASAGSWVLGSSTGENILEARVAGLSPVQFSATATSAFAIDLRIIGSLSAAETSALTAAVATWRAAITGDVSDVRLTATANECFAGQPAIDEVIDDLVLFVKVGRIDGAGQVLAEAGPCYTRGSTSLPALGVLILDSDDLRTIEGEGLLRDLASHEIGHVLGFGTLWSDLRLLTGAGSSDPRFIGTGAIGAYQVLGGGASGVPVENGGDEGTRDSHWRESVFGNELMTGYINRGSNPLSALSIASLRDLGYSTDARAATAYALPLAGLRSADVVPGDSLAITAHEVLLTPRRRIGSE